MMKYKFLFILFIMIIFVTGCSNDKCIKSHEETKPCIRYITMPKPKGGIQMVPISTTCKIKVCDLYESEELK